MKRRRKRREPKPPTTIDQYTDTCWLAHLDPSVPCDGYLQRAHLVKEQFLRDAIGLSMEERWRPCWWVPACAEHHRRLDGLLFRLTRDQLPPELEAAAREYPRVEARLTRDYGARKKIIERAA